MKAIPFFLLAASSVLAQEAPPVPEKAAAPAVVDSEKSVLFIDPKSRAADYMQAFELLRKDKPTLKVQLKTSGGAAIQITELTASASGTLLFVKIPASSGSKYMIVPIEDIQEISYSAG